MSRTLNDFLATPSMLSEESLVALLRLGNPIEAVSAVNKQDEERTQGGSSGGDSLGEAKTGGANIDLTLIFMELYVANDTEEELEFEFEYNAPPDYTEDFSPAGAVDPATISLTVNSGTITGTTDPTDAGGSGDLSGYETVTLYYCSGGSPVAGQFLKLIE